jgi:AcrR family transcriptional regulator
LERGSRGRHPPLSAIATDPPYAPLLKRRPVQARSVARVSAILDAAAAIAADDLDALTMRAVAARAGVPPATIYQFFDDRESLTQALALSYVASTPDVLEASLAVRTRHWSRTLDRVIDGFAEMLRRAPAMRALWLAGAMDATTARTAASADDAIAERLRDRLVDQARSADRGSAADWRFLVTLVGGLLRRAFQHDPRGDRALLTRAKRVATLYAADLLGVRN